MRVINTEIPDVKILEPELYGDNRGYFMETFRQQWFEKLDVSDHFVQDNQSKSVRGTLRGLHYQIRNPQGKFLRVLKGEVYDVAVDLRESSATFKKWVGISLSEENNHGIWVPPGFAHGFYVCSDSAEILYKCTDYYSPEYERSLLWDDEELGISWPLGNDTVLLSEKDKNGTLLSDCEYYV